VLAWHNAMAILQFKLDQLFVLLGSDLVVEVVGAFRFPSEPGFGHCFVSTRSAFHIACFRAFQSMFQSVPEHVPFAFPISS
jgi:hypothetical protein